MTDKVAVVTGGSRGIGEAICLRLAEAGYTVIPVSRKLEKVSEVAEQLTQAGHRAQAKTLDVRQIDSFKDFAKELVSEFGGIHVLVNNAGMTADNLMLRIKPEAFDSVVETNLRGSFFLSQAVLRPMMKQKFGRIINISSVVGLMGNVGQANYAASKAGMIGFTKSLAREVGSRGITVNAIAPGYVETDMTADLGEAVKKDFMDRVPLGRMGKPDDIALAVQFLAGPGGAYITGQTITVDGGLYM